MTPEVVLKLYTIIEIAAIDKRGEAAAAGEGNISSSVFDYLVPCTKSTFRSGSDGIRRIALVGHTRCAILEKKTTGM